MSSMIVIQIISSQRINFMIYNFWWDSWRIIEMATVVDNLKCIGRRVFDTCRVNFIFTCYQHVIVTPHLTYTRLYTYAHKTDQTWTKYSCLLQYYNIDSLTMDVPLWNFSKFTLSNSIWKLMINLRIFMGTMGRACYMKYTTDIRWWQFQISSSPKIIWRFNCNLLNNYQN